MRDGTSNTMIVGDVEGVYCNDKEQFIATGTDRSLDRTRDQESGDFIPYRDRVRIDAEDVAEWRPSASDKFSSDLKMTSAILGEFVLKDESKATAAHIALDLQKHLIAAGFSEQERRSLIADLFRLTKQKAQEWLRYPMRDN